MLIDMPPADLIDRVAVLVVKMNVTPDPNISGQFENGLAALKVLPVERMHFYLDRLYALNMEQWTINERIFDIESWVGERDLSDGEIGTIAHGVIRSCAISRERTALKVSANAEFGYPGVKEDAIVDAIAA